MYIEFADFAGTVNKQSWVVLFPSVCVRPYVAQPDDPRIPLR